MAEFNYSYVATDGLLPTPDLNFSSEINLQQLVTGQLTKIQVPNFSSNYEYPCIYYKPEGANTTPGDVNRYYYDSETSQWKFAGLYVPVLGKYLRLFIPFSNMKNIYMCLKETDLAVLPHLDAGGIFVTVDGIPDIANFNQYKTVRTDKLIDMIPISFTYSDGSTDGTSGRVGMIGLNKTNDQNGFWLHCDNVTSGGANSSISDTGLLLPVSITILAPGENPPNIYERVTDLEIAVTEISSEVTKIQDSLQQLTKVLNTASSFFVSR